MLLLPSIGTVHDLKMAAANNARVVRIATHVTESEIAEEHVEAAKKPGMEAYGFLMMNQISDVTYQLSKAKTAENALEQTSRWREAEGAAKGPQRIRKLYGA